MSVQITDTIIKVTGVQVVKAQEALVTAIGGATATAIAAAVPDAPPNVDEDGIAAGGFILRATRRALVQTVIDLRTHAVEMDLDYEALLVDVADIRTKMNDLLTKIKAHGLIASA